jgi:serine/threonine protein kinase
MYVTHGSQAVSPDRSFGRFRINEKLGAGGMGEVYRATDTKLGRTVAVKILPPDYAADVSRRSRFEREARAAAALNHPNIVTVYDSGVEAEARWIAMECVEGRTLRLFRCPDWTRRGRRLRSAPSHNRS